MFLVDMTFVDLAKLTPELTEQHKGYLSKEYESGKLMFGGRKIPRTGGLLLSRHDNEAQLKEMLNADPFVVNGVVTFSITIFEPVMAAADFKQLLS